MFATYIPYIGGRFIVIGLSAKGTEYVEEYLLSKQEKLVDSLSDTDKSIKSGAKFEIDFGDDDALLSSKENIDEKRRLLQRTVENYSNLRLILIFRKMRMLIHVLE